MAYIIMAYTVMAYVVMAYVLMAYVLWPMYLWLQAFQFLAPGRFHFGSQHHKKQLVLDQKLARNWTSSKRDASELWCLEFASAAQHSVAIEVLGSAADPTHGGFGPMRYLQVLICHRRAAHIHRGLCMARAHRRSCVLRCVDGQARF